MMFLDRLFLLIICCLLPAHLLGQVKDSVVSTPDSTAILQVRDSSALALPAADSLLVADSLQTGDSLVHQRTKVNLVHANVWSYDKERNKDAQVLVGEVCFRHDSSYMYCDSAYFFESTNSLEAFSHVRMEQGDTLFVYGDYLFYDGNAKTAYLRDSVRMENRQVTLYTDSLNYERIRNIGYYFDGGKIVDSLNVLSSFYGQYSPATKMAVFNDSVRLENPNFTLYSDTLHYNTVSKIADILGPSVIVSDSGTINTSQGWYNTVENTSSLLQRSVITSGDKLLIGDSIFYDRNAGYGEVFGNMNIVDSARHVILEGNYGRYNEKTGLAFATDSARCLEFSQGDTLYLHADTLLMQTMDPLAGDTLRSPIPAPADSLSLAAGNVQQSDTTYREIKAFHGVRFYRKDMQGVCDSMYFSTRDSVLILFKDPVVWNEQYQLYGDTISVYMNDSTIDYAHVRQFSFAAQHVDSTYYNQLKGNDLKAYFQGQAVRQIDVEGNAESIFYPLENDGSKIARNKTQSGFLSIWIKENKLDKLKIWPAPSGKTIPIPDLTPDDKMLKDFYWFDYLRPKSKDDIYKVVKRKVSEAPKKSNKFVH